MMNEVEKLAENIKPHILNHEGKDCECWVKVGDELYRLTGGVSTWEYMTEPTIQLSECEDRYLYRIESRNLGYGVFRKATGGFVGIRTKFNDRYLFEEYHFDTGTPYGTVFPKEKLELLPAEIGSHVSEPTQDSKTKRLVKFDKPISDGGRGWYFIDTDEASTEIDPVCYDNEALFKWLQEKEKTK